MPYDAKLIGIFFFFQQINKGYLTCGVGLFDCSQDDSWLSDRMHCLSASSDTSVKY